MAARPPGSGLEADAADELRKRRTMRGVLRIRAVGDDRRQVADQIEYIGRLPASITSESAVTSMESRATIKGLEDVRRIPHCSRSSRIAAGRTMT